MKNVYKKVSFIFLLISFVLMNTTSFAAQGDIYLSPSSADVSSGSTVDLELYVDVGTTGDTVDPQTLGSWTFTISFGTSILSFNESTGYADGADVSGAIITNNLTGAASGSIILGGFHLTGITGTSGVINIATLTFSVSGSPTASQLVSISAVAAFSNSSGAAFTSSITNSTLTIPTAALSSFTIATISTQTAGTAFDIAITAIDTDSATKTDFTGTVDITSTGTLSSGSGTSASFVSGVLSAHNVTISNTGSFTITATETSATATGTSSAFTVGAGTLATIAISPSTSTVCPTATATYTATGYDALSNSTGDVTSGTTFAISTGDGGSWADNVYTSVNSGSFTVTGTHTSSSETDTATLTVSPTYALTLTSSPSAGGSATASTTPLSGTNIYCQNTAVTISAEAAAGYQFSSWTGDVASSTSATTTVTMDEDQSVTANFTIVAGAQPVVQALSPTLISNDVANTISIIGENFGSSYTYSVYIVWVADYVPTAVCEGTSLTVQRVSSTELQATVPVNQTRGVYDVTVCVGGLDAAAEGVMLQLRIAEPAVTSDDQDEIEDAIEEAETVIENVATVLPDYDYTEEDPEPLTDAELTTLGLSDLADLNEDVDFKIEVVNNEIQVTATTTEPVQPTDTGTLPIQYTLESVVDPEATPIDEDKDVEIKVTLPKGITITDAAGNAFTEAILPPAQEIVPDEVAEDLGDNAVAFSMGSATETLTFDTPVFVEFNVTLPSTATAPKIYYVGATGTYTLAGVVGTAPDGSTVAIGGTIISQGTVGSETIYNMGIMLSHMSTYYAGTVTATAESSGSSSIFICFISSLAGNASMALPGILTVLLLIGSALGLYGIRRKKD